MQYPVSYCLYYVLKDKTSKKSAEKGAYQMLISDIFVPWVLFYVHNVICQPKNSDVHRGKAEVNITFEG